MGNRCNITLVENSLVVQTPYDGNFVDALKVSIPATQRKFDKVQRAWIVDPQYGAQVAKLIGQFLGEMVFVPTTGTVKPVIETRILEIHYLGQCKDRGNEVSAFGLDVAGEWSAIFPEVVLRSWFLDDQSKQQPGGVQTLYQTLSIPGSAANDEIKAAFRRLARQWHPDVCKEVDAAQRFMRIKDAYELLSDPNKRARYEAGLMLEASISNQRIAFVPDQNLYRAPLRCGYILAEGHDSLGRFIIDKILSWEDITDVSGRTLVTSWPMGAKQPTEAWV
jgi:hypothetical protein